MLRTIARLVFPVTLALVLGMPPGLSTVWADAGYFTTYNHHIEKGEVEIMLMSDFTHPSAPRRESDGQENYFSQMLELEYAPTDQLALEFMTEAFEDVGTGEKEFTGFRYEARYRLFKDAVPLNPMAYVEYEDLDPATRYKMEISGWVNPPYEEKGGEPDRERILETRLVLSQDFGRWNAAFNWINESDFHSGDTAFGYALGVSYTLHGSGHEEHTEHSHHSHEAHGGLWLRPASIAFELIGALGDTRAFGLRPSRQEHYVQPSIMFHVGEHAMMSVGFAIGLTKASDDVVRVACGWEF